MTFNSKCSNNARRYFPNRWPKTRSREITSAYTSMTLFPKSNYSFYGWVIKLVFLTWRKNIWATLCVCACVWHLPATALTQLTIVYKWFYCIGLVKNSRYFNKYAVWIWKRYWRGLSLSAGSKKVHEQQLWWKKGGVKDRMKDGSKKVSEEKMPDFSKATFSTLSYLKNEKNECVAF